MDAGLLIKELSKPLDKKRVVSLAIESYNSISELLELCLLSNYETAFRAAWVLEILTSKHPDKFKDHISEFIAVYVKLKNQSGQRHFTKILMDLTRKDRLTSIELVIDLEAIVEITFELMIDPQTPVAVRVNCMDILYNLQHKYNWIADELRAQIEFQLRDGSAAVQSRGKKLLHKLSRH